VSRSGHREKSTGYDGPTIIPAAGEPPKRIEEYIGRVNTKTDAVSIAYMTSPVGWKEPGQVGEFDEYTIVIRGTLHVELREEEIDVQSGQAIIVYAGEWVQYSTPSTAGAEYIAVCLTAFGPNIIKRDVKKNLERQPKETGYGPDSSFAKT